ncbi:hypothetical protein J3E69DRAFT_4184 [Trichoderma sp. SZMC 28015]
MKIFCSSICYYWYPLLVSAAIGIFLWHVVLYPYFSIGIVVSGIGIYHLCTAWEVCDMMLDSRVGMLASISLFKHIKIAVSSLHFVLQNRLHMLVDNFSRRAQ